MICKDCIHFDVCEALESNGISKIYPSQCGCCKPKSRFIELPCEVGDTVYIPWIYNNIRGICFCDVTHIIMSINKSYVKTNFCTDDEGFWEEFNGGEFEFDDFGKTVFLTKEEAEKALAERNNEILKLRIE